MSVILTSFLYVVLMGILISDLILLMSGTWPDSNNRTDNIYINGTYTFSLENNHWHNYINIDNYAFEEFCTNLIYTTRMYDKSNNSEIIFYADDTHIFDGANKQIYTISKRNISSLKACFTITSIPLQEIVVTVNCYLLGRRYDFIHNTDLVAFITLVNNTWILKTYTNVDLRLYGSFISKLIFSPYNEDNCNYYFMYTSAFILIVIFTHCLLCACIHWSRYHSNRENSSKEES